MIFTWKEVMMVFWFGGVVGAVVGAAILWYIFLKVLLPKYFNRILKQIDEEFKNPPKRRDLKMTSSVRGNNNNVHVNQSGREE